ncbi:hypothetical protein [Olsenella uli]
MSKNNYERAVAALVACSTTKEAARVAGMGESTLRAYKSDPEFVELYTAARHELLDTGVKALQSKFSDAVDVICEIMTDKEASPSVRLSAANSIIQNVVRLTDQTESMERAATGRRLNRELLGDLSDIFPANK